MRAARRRAALSIPPPMASARPSPGIVPLALAAALAVPLAWASGAILFSTGRERAWDVAYVPHGRSLQLLSPAVRLSIANYFWLLTIQYVGDDRADVRGFEKLFPLVDLVTDLDPRHGYAYQSAGVVLSTRDRLEESDRILRKGMEQGPNWWSFPFYLAFNDYFYRGNYESAAHWAEIAAKTPGASPNISHLALAMKVKSGEPEDAVRFLEEMLATVKEDAVRAALEEQHRLALLQVAFRDLDAAVERFRNVRGRLPAPLDELVAAGILKALPPDPFGGRFELRADGKVHSTARDHRFSPAEPWLGRRYRKGTP
jgi:tetratricopeptide (TPR) repeat protein